MNLGLISALIVDDNAFDRRRIARIAGTTSLDFFLKEVGNVQEFGQIIDREKFDVIYVDLNIAGDDGRKLLPGVRASRINADAAMIMVAGDNHAEVALQALREGFADYIEKDALSASSLERATVSAIQKLRLARAASTAEEETRSVEALLKSFATACSQEMRPLLARLVRQVRQMKADAEQKGLGSMHVVDVEKTCARMDEFFQDLGSMAASGNLSSVIGEASFAAPNGWPTVAEAAPKIAPRRHIRTGNRKDLHLG